MKTVLLVDDSATMLMSMKAGLEISGYRVAVAHDGEQAMSLLQGGLKPDLIITDIHMPKMDGIEFIRQARKTLRFTPILALTTEGQQARRDQARQLGATGWMLKPVRGGELLKVISQVSLQFA
ncbi:two-component system chemotaxis response regulator CheY [Aquabacterium commune]|uniref:Two-component system chemotaxis response regulator CheY n=1 Tax=Aquabacterium commune TaxID=70586 RepID=A0A4V3CV65_9BURK|nr:response regulator [Aquabacterium commune]TDP81278.1 two-component system chemotaxis response regulator CheY [Aquabacterium commune]